MPSSKSKYTDPELRDEVKEEVQASDKGGAPGQWSARKAQMMVSEYKKRGGGYQTDKKDQDESQKHLSKWTEEEWQTKEGSGDAKKEDGTQQRYLPKKAWEAMNEQEKEATEEKKQEGSKEGQQFVQNTPKAKSARKKANEEEDMKYEKKKEQETTEGTGRQTRSRSKRDSNTEDQEDSGAGTGGKQPADKQKSAPKKSAQKRSRAADSEEGAEDKPSAKRPKDGPEKTASGESNGTIGSRHDKADPPATQASKSRLPKKGQTIQWRAMPGWIEGTVVEVVKSGKQVEGKQVKASKDDPRIVMKSKAGKIAVHKPDVCYFD